MKKLFILLLLLPLFSIAEACDVATTNFSPDHGKTQWYNVIKTMTAFKTPGTKYQTMPDVFCVASAKYYPYGVMEWYVEINGVPHTFAARSFSASKYISPNLLVSAEIRPIDATGFYYYCIVS